MEKFSHQVRSAREGLGKTQADFAALLGVSANYVYMLEKGKKDPSPQLVLSLERLMKEGSEALQKPIQVRLPEKVGSPSPAAQPTSDELAPKTPLEQILLGHEKVPDALLWEILETVISTGHLKSAANVAEALALRKSKRPEGPAPS